MLLSSHRCSPQSQCYCITNVIYYIWLNFNPVRFHPMILSSLPLFLVGVSAHKSQSICLREFVWYRSCFVQRLHTHTHTHTHRRTHSRTHSCTYTRTHTYQKGPGPSPPSSGIPDDNCCASVCVCMCVRVCA